MRSLKTLEEKLINGQIEEQEIGLLAECYTKKTRGLFWDIVDLKKLGRWEDAERLQLELNELDEREADFYEFLIYFLESQNGESELGGYDVEQ